MTDKTNELKPCPFCDSEEIHRGINHLHYRECQNCLAWIGDFESSEAADMVWNTRFDAGYNHAAAEMRWIPIRSASDLPEIGKKYLFTYPFRGGGRAVKEVYFDAREQDLCLQFGDRYLAWMPLPKPYTEPADNIGKMEAK